MAYNGENVKKSNARKKKKALYHKGIRLDSIIIKCLNTCLTPSLLTNKVKHNNQSNEKIRCPQIFHRYIMRR